MPMPTPATAPTIAWEVETGTSVAALKGLGLGDDDALADSLHHLVALDHAAEDDKRVSKLETFLPATTAVSGADYYCAPGMVN